MGGIRHGSYLAADLLIGGSASGCLLLEAQRSKDSSSVDIPEQELDIFPGDSAGTNIFSKAGKVRTP
jgi:hypothetical protein